ncbi:MAG TPA: S1C family serine protease [Nitrospiraceae bacterium]|nr:S1C family serine protease [Nitrospiraceae bacterium]
MLEKALFVTGALLMLGVSPAMAQTDEHRFAAGVEKAKRSTVGVLQNVENTRIQKGRPNFVPRGSGFHLRDGYIVTARHAVERDETGQKAIPKEITVLTTELEELPAELTGVNEFLDVAVYRLREGGSTSLKPVAFGKKEPESGDELFTVGYPLGWGPAVGFGRLGNANVFLPIVDSRLFQIDLSACSGNSGGGLFNAEGEVVGVVNAIIQTETVQGEPRCSRFAFAVPGLLVQRIVEALIQGQQPSFSKLGIQLTVVKVGTRWRVAVSEAAGPALDGGLRKGDILLAIDDTTITDGIQLKNYLIERTTPGQKVSVKVLRGDSEQVLYVTLGKA